MPLPMLSALPRKPVLLLSTALLSGYALPAMAAAPMTPAAAPAVADTDSDTSSAILVTGAALHHQAQTAEEARKIQKQAPNLVNVASQEEIKQMPNFVLGDAVRRLPGASVINKSGESRSIQIRGIDPNLNGVTYEGVLLPAGSINSTGRAVPFDAIPAPLVGGLELIKTNTPAQEAVALGGQINLLSHDIAPGEAPYLNVTVAGGIHQPHPTGIFQGTLNAGIRFGLDSNPFDRNNSADKPFALTFFVTDMRDAMDLDDLQQTFADKSTLPGNTLSKAQQLEYTQTKNRRGYGGTFSWDVDKNTTLYFKGFASGIDFHPIKNQLLYTFSNQSFTTPTPGTYNATTTLSQGFNDNLIHDDERLYKFGGLSHAGKVTIDYYGAYASNRLYSPYSYSATLTNPTSASVYVDNVTAPQLPTMTAANGALVTNYAAYNLTSLSNAYQDDRDGQWSGHVGLSAPLDLGAIKGTLSVGGGLRLEKVTHDDRTYTYSGVPALTGAQLAGTNSYTIFDGAYNLGTALSGAAIRQLITGGSVTENAATDAITNRQALLNDNENVYNGYIQYTASWNRLGVLAGLRYEKTDGVYRGTATSVASGVTTLAPRTVSRSYSNLFPTIQLRYSITDDLIARANWSTAIGRPGFSQLTATQTVNYATGAITQGNPDLRATTGNNYDASIEYYLPLGGIVSAGVFDKEFSNYVVATTTNGSFAGIAGNATFSTYGNIPHASARGFELNYHQQFTFLPGLLSGFGIGGNFTFVNSHGATRNGYRETLAYTTPRTFNVEAFYKRGPLSLQLFGNYQGLTMTSLGSTPVLDNYVQPYLNFDLDARYAINKHVTVFFQGRNITRENQVATEGKSSARFTELQYFGSSYLFGVDFKM